VTESRKPDHPHARAGRRSGMEPWRIGGGKDLRSSPCRGVQLIRCGKAIVAVAVSNSAADQPTNELGRERERERDRRRESESGGEGDAFPTSHVVADGTYGLACRGWARVGVGQPTVAQFGPDRSDGAAPAPLGQGPDNPPWTWTV
jgi:hypothetical protein